MSSTDAVAVADVDQRPQHVDDVRGLAVGLDQRLGEIVAAAAEVQRSYRMPAPFTSLRPTRRLNFMRPTADRS